MHAIAKSTRLYQTSMHLLIRKYAGNVMSILEVLAYQVWALLRVNLQGGV